MLSGRSWERYQEVNKAIWEEMDVNVFDLCSKNRTPSVVEAKFVAWYILHVRFHIPFVIVAEMYTKDHTTVINGVRRVQEELNGQMITKAQTIIKKYFPKKEYEQGLQMQRV